MEQAEELHLRAKELVEAERIQRDLAARVEIRPLGRPVRTIAAVDADYQEAMTCAAAVLFDYNSCDIPLEQRIAARPIPFPYLPGYLSLREAPAVLDALNALSQPPDVILVDGQGIAHPRRFGVACHIGVLSGIPTIGCAKSRLVGLFLEPGLQRGEWTPLEVDGEMVGAVLRTRTGVRPVFVSPGHLVSHEEAIAIVLHCATRYRIPEPLRAADSAAKAARRGWMPR